MNYDVTFHYIFPSSGLAKEYINVTEATAVSLFRQAFVIKNWREMDVKIEAHNKHKVKEEN